MAKILLVEDNEMNWEMLSERLTMRGFDVVIAIDGVQGLAMAQSETPDLILMDISLPEIDGLEATKRLKALPQTSQIPIIILTSHAMSGDRERALKSGCDDYDTKPINFPQLLEKMNRLLKKRQTNDLQK